ncbi:uncharacterized protein [Amphiura filiformis]|uniref:uncharacterized protein isoform X1 n=1 Tax=Amphiura filiformis TaxID=82378 RepID=UPI003B20EA1B
MCKLTMATVKRRNRMRDQDGKNPCEEVIPSEDANMPPKKVVRKNPVIPVPVVEAMDVCLIRFGSWTPTDIYPVVFQSNCILFSFNPERDHCAQVRLEAKDITLCQYNLKSEIPTIFLYTTPMFAMVFRERLKMVKGSGIYFDPTSRVESEKRIIVRPLNDLSHYQAAKILQAFRGMAACNNMSKSVLFEELDNVAINSLLVISKPPENMFRSSRVRQQSVSNASPHAAITKSPLQSSLIVIVDPKTLKITKVQRMSADGIKKRLPMMVKWC